MNKENFKKVLDKIKKNPDSWDQGEWHSESGTAHCFAGHCQIEMGRPVDLNTVRRDARIFLSISYQDAFDIFESSRTIKDFENMLTGSYIFFGGNHFSYIKYNEDGYNRYGRDKDGFDRVGFDRDGLDKDYKPATMYGP